jgi:hypothetical protein
MPQDLAADQILLNRNSHLSLVRQGGYFFLFIATTIATIVAIKTASKVRAANTIDST